MSLKKTTFMTCNQVERKGQILCHKNTIGHKEWPSKIGNLKV